MKGSRRERLGEAAWQVVSARWRAGGPDDEAPPRPLRGQDGIDVEAFDRVERIWAEAGKMGEHPDYAELLGQPCWRERWVSMHERLASTFAPVGRPQWLALASLVLLFTMTLWANRDQGPDFVTETAEVRRLPLEDGSIVTLGARSALDVDFAKNVRRARLVEGEAFFSVSPDAARPFIVEAGKSLIRVVGTKFNVNNAGGRVQVAVLEGSVEILRAGAADGPAVSGEARLRLVAGQQATVSAGLARPVIGPPALVEPGSWREGRLSYEGASLADIVTDANRYRKGEIRIGSPALARERITTSFSAGQIDQMLDTLPDLLPLKVQRQADGSVDLTPAEKPEAAS